VTICRHCGAALNNRDHDCEGGLCEACREFGFATAREEEARRELRDRQRREARKQKRRT
jgi:hypothetical protein